MLRPPDVVYIYAGSAEDVVIPLFDDAGAALLSLDGWSGSAQARHVPNAVSPVLAEWSTGAGTLVLVDSSARLKVTAALALESLGWSWSAAWLDLRLVTPEGQGSLPFRPFRALVRVLPGITRMT